MNAKQAKKGATTGLDFEEKHTLQVQLKNTESQPLTTLREFSIKIQAGCRKPEEDPCESISEDDKGDPCESISN